MLLHLRFQPSQVVKQEKSGPVGPIGHLISIGAVPELAKRLPPFFVLPFHLLQESADLSLARL